MLSMESPSTRWKPSLGRKDADEARGPDPMSLGGTEEELARAAHDWWIAAASTAGIDMTGFDPAAPLSAVPLTYRARHGTLIAGAKHLARRTSFDTCWERTGRGYKTGHPPRN
jgi:hypothetical protein